MPIGVKADIKIGDTVWFVDRENPNSDVNCFNINVLCAEVVEISEEHIRACIILDCIAIAEYTQLKTCVFKSGKQCMRVFIKHLMKKRFYGY